MTQAPAEHERSPAAAKGGSGFSRRDALRLLAAHMTAALAACARPDESIVPYVRMPERITPGEPLRFATALSLSGYGRGVLVTSIDGRPIKVAGNPRHPASLGATDAFAEADILSLYDPDRSRAVQHEGEIAAWDTLLQALVPVRQRMSEQEGEGFRLLTGRVTSPTLARQLGDLLARYPKAIWHAHEPIDGEAARRGAEIAFGRPVSILPRLRGAEVIVTLDADPIGPGPDQVRNARTFGPGRTARARDAGDGAATMSRVYALETAPTLTGAQADHRVALAPHLVEEAALALANALGAGLRAAALPQEAAHLVEAAAADLQARKGHALVLGGDTLSAPSHALVHWINARLEAPLDLIAPVDHPDGREPASLEALARDLDAGAVQTLVILDTNPVYTAPADLNFAAALAKAPLRLHVGRYADETAARCNWHVPLSHPLESWSDIRATDGTASIIQPLIRPLYGSRTVHEIMAALLDQSEQRAYELVRETWMPLASGDFEAWWTAALRAGVVPDSAAAKLELDAPQLPTIPDALPPPEGLALVLRPDACTWDGSYANNAWLQELPKPLTKQVWGNAVGLGPAQARRLGLQRGDIVRVQAGALSAEASIEIEAGVADGVASLTLGYGRSRAGAIGNRVGANAYALRHADSPWVLRNIVLQKTGRRGEILITQNRVRSGQELAPDELQARFPILGPATLPQGAKSVEQTAPLPSLLPDRPLPAAEHAWAMTIDTSLCIGCNACVVACQAENSVPVVGPEEVARGRQMHWLRVDVYDHGTAERPRPGFQPVPCMHCEHAPCEPVCPVAASVHDGEGLNVQVYNRCIGTRFCQANCPYKVRRFNFFGYADGQEYANLGFETYKAQKNPEVTVRARGVMEKCTYCVQRISAARRAGEREHRTLRDDEVTTACQDACPTRAIVFGDLTQANAAVNERKRDARHYALLGHLDTRPRTTYLARLHNPNPAAEGGA